MAGIIDLKYDLKKQTWTARPRFAHPAWGFSESAPRCEKRLLDQAFHGLCELLPEDMANELRKVYPRRMYNSPERDLGDIDKCIEVDGHWPSPQEYRERFFAWMQSQATGQQYIQPKNTNNKSQEEMEIQGKIIQVLPPQTGVGRDGNPWKVQQYILETQEQYPKKVCFEVMGEDRINNNPAAVGDLVRVSFDIESREFNARWYTTIRAWKVEKQAA